MQLLSFLSFATTIGIVAAQVCPELDVIFLLGQSENAKLSATDTGSSTSFNLLQDAVRSFLNNPAIQASPNVRIGAYGYSGVADQTTFIPEGSSLDVALSRINQIGTGPGGGSRTYKGLEMITRKAPTTSTNLVIVISSQGWNSGQFLTRQEYTRVHDTLEWPIRVVAIQGGNPLNLDDLRAANGGTTPIILGENTGVKNYTLLPAELTNIINNILCVETAAPTVRPTEAQETFAPGVCSDCVSKGGFILKDDPNYCDRYYICLAGQPPINKLCPAGTFFDGYACNHRDSSYCSIAPCTDANEGQVYENGRCCNQYYRCKSRVLVTEICPEDSYFDKTSGQCAKLIDEQAICFDRGMHVCDRNPSKISTCPFYQADEFGNSCVFWFGGHRLATPAGTIWDQARCILAHSTVKCDGTNLISDRLFDFGDLASQCTPVFRTTFDGASTSAYNERLSTVINLYTINNEIIMQNNAVTFTPNMVDPFLYYYFFNSIEIPVDSAFRIRFRLENFILNREYDILSNNYCARCRETVSFTVQATSSASRVVIVTFLTNDGNTVTTSAALNGVNSNDLLEMTVVFGNTAVYGQLNAVSQSNPDGAAIQSSDFATVPKSEGATILRNKCGFQFGRGPNAKFTGIMDDFALYEACESIASVLR